MKSIWSVLIVSIVSSSLVAFFTTSYLLPAPEEPGDEKTTEELIADFYDIEVAVSVSPHGLRKKMDKGDKSFILVDLRSQEEYETEHVVGAINIPAYSDPNNSAYDQVDRIVNSFRELEKEGKEIIVYCYSIPCMTGRKIGHMLADHDIYVKALGVGWNEWKYYWNLWNHDGEAAVNPEDYVISGSEPGEPKINLVESLSPCTIDEEFGC